MAEKEFHEVANLFPFIEGQEFEDLVNDIRENGLQQPIWTYQGKIIDGRNRYRACLKAGVEPRYQEWDGKGSLVAFTISLNVKRRHLTSSQLAIIAPEVERLLAKENKVGRPAKDTENCGNISTISGKSRDHAADLLGTNSHYVTDAKRIEERAPDLIDHIKNGTLTIPDAKAIADLPKAKQEVVVQKAIQRKEEEGKRVSSAVRDAIWEEEEKDRQTKIQQLLEHNELLRAKRAELPDGRYSCIVIDPPWEMQKIERDVRPNQFAFDYPTMNEEELKAFPLPALAADDCHLYLWTTQKHLPLALRLAEHWGFNYQCLLTWRKNVGFTPFSWMYSTEHVLFCTKGHLPLLKLGKRLDFEAKVREHSRKPDEFYELVKEVSPGPRIDVFSREKRDGFDQYGNEVEKYVSA
jgi:N6-adenosine-specific RNA methylase IME4